MNDQPPPPPPGVHNGREQAFATASCIAPNGDFQWGAPGLSKREYFAAMALQGLCANGIPGSHHAPNNVAREAVDRADALLAELDKSR